MSGTPNLLQSTPILAPSSTTLRSHMRASSSPPATHHPDTAAIVGLVSSRREGPCGEDKNKICSMTCGRVLQY